MSAPADFTAWMRYSEKSAFAQLGTLKQTRQVGARAQGKALTCLHAIGKPMVLTNGKAFAVVPAIPCAHLIPRLAAKAGRQTDVTHFADWEQHSRGIGSKLMARMGYIKGQGLGRAGAVWYSCTCRGVTGCGWAGPVADDCCLKATTPAVWAGALSDELDLPAVASSAVADSALIHLSCIPVPCA